MIEELLRQDRELIRARINGETAKIPWRELQRFFAAGKVLQVAHGIDLIDVAEAMQQDDVERVNRYCESAQLSAVSDAQARVWIDAERSLWAVVIKPWVLVQEPD